MSSRGSPIPLAMAARRLALPVDYLEGLAKADQLRVFEVGGEQCISVEELDALASKGGHHPTGHWPRITPKPGKSPTIKP